jgi:Na+/melibiose symporter-like transporter
LIFDSDPEITYRPILSAVRGAAITLFALLAFFMASGVDRMQHAWPYLGAIALAFALHYISAWLTVRRMRQRYHEKQQGKGDAEGT